MTVAAFRARIGTLVRTPIWRMTTSLLVVGMSGLGYGSNARIPTACELEWDSSVAFRQNRLSSKDASLQRQLAEKGDAQAQFFMGIAVDLEQKEREKWIQLASANGSRGAAAYYSYYFDERWLGILDGSSSNQTSTSTRRPISTELQTQLLQPILDAAEAGEPQPATWLLQMARGDRKPCAFRLATPCADAHPLIKREDIVKWAEIATRGGNMGAGEYLCERYEYAGREGPASQSDDNAAFHWCSIAATATCATSAKAALSRLYRDGRGTTKSAPLARYWNERFIDTWSAQKNQTQIINKISADR